MNSVILTEAFFKNIPDNSYIQILKPNEREKDYTGHYRMWHISILTPDKRRIRATSCGVNLQECVNEISTVDMTLAKISSLLRPREIEKIDSKKINRFIRNMWKQVNG